MKKIILLMITLLNIFTVYAQKAHRDPEQRASMFSEKLATELSLTEDQKKKIYDIVVEQQKTKEAIIAKNEGNKELAKKELKKERESYNLKLKEILTPEQYVQWEQKKKEKKEKHLNDKKQNKSSSE